MQSHLHLYSSSRDREGSHLEGDREKYNALFILLDGVKQKDNENIDSYFTVRSRENTQCITGKCTLCGPEGHAKVASEQRSWISWNGYLLR